MVRRLIGGFVVAVVIALALTKTAEAVYFECVYWWQCWPF